MKLLKYLIFLLPAFCARAQGSFFKTYGKVPHDYCYSLQRTFDGGCILSGTTNGYGGTSYLFLVRTDANGDTLWMRGYSPGYITLGYSVAQCADSGFAVCGGQGIERVDKNGNLLWNFVYTNTTFNSVRETADKGLILAGSFGQSGGSNGMDVFMIKTDSNGVKQWSRKFGGPIDEYATCVRQTNDGGYIVAGSTDSYGAGGWDTYVIRTDANGDTLWTRTYGSAGNEGGTTTSRQVIEQTSDGGYVIGGYSNGFATVGGNDAYLVKTDAGGNVAWSRMYGGLANEVINDVKQCADGGYACVGSTNSFGGGSTDIYFVRTNATGDTLFTRCYGGLLSEVGHGLLLSPDKGFMIGGYTANFGAGNNDAILLKLDSMGNSACHQEVTGTSVTAPATLAAATATGKIFLTVNVTTVNPAGKGGGTVTEVCSINGIATAEQNAVKLYPNPAGDVLYVEAAGSAELLIFDVLGNRMLREQVNARARVSLEALRSGTYFAELRTTAGQQKFKLLITK
jgi:hypothetical protein